MSEINIDILKEVKDLFLRTRPGRLLKYDIPNTKQNNWKPDAIYNLSETGAYSVYSKEINVDGVNTFYLLVEDAGKRLYQLADEFIKPNETLNIEKATILKKGELRCQEKDKAGYVITKMGEEIKIGRISALPYRGLEILLEVDLEASLPLESFFNKIYENKAPGKLKSCKNDAEKKAFIQRLIINSFQKALQKNKAFTKHLSVIINKNDNRIYLKSSESKY